MYPSAQGTYKRVSVRSVRRLRPPGKVGGSAIFAQLVYYSKTRECVVESGPMIMPFKTPTALRGNQGTYTRPVFRTFKTAPVPPAVPRVSCQGKFVLNMAPTK